MSKIIGSIGLGAMGGEYAKHLLENNFKVFGIDPDIKNSNSFTLHGGILFNNIPPYNVKELEFFLSGSMPKTLKLFSSKCLAYSPPIAPRPIEPIIFDKSIPPIILN